MSSREKELAPSIDTPVELRKTAEQLEGVAKRYVEATFRRAAEVLGRCERFAGKYPELAEKAVRLKAKIKMELTKSLKVLRVATAVSAIALGGYYANYERTRYDVEEGIDHDGKKIFLHEDKETSNILDYLSGRTDLPRDMKLRLAKEFLPVATTNAGLTSPAKEELKVMSEEELKEAFEKLYNKSPRFIWPRIYADGEWLDALFARKPEIDEEMYHGLWEIERIAGNPRIRWRKSGHGEDLSSTPHYNSITNTLYIGNPIDYFEVGMIEEFVSEAAHGKQFHEKPVSSGLRWLKDVVGTAAEAASLRSPSRAYEGLYAKPGTVEYEAHRVIEPELKKKLWK